MKKYLLHVTDSDGKDIVGEGFMYNDIFYFYDDKLNEKYHANVIHNVKEIDIKDSM